MHYIALAAIVLSLAFTPWAGWAAEGEGSGASGEESPREVLIGSSVKFLAKGYIAVTDIDKAKKSNIARLEKMSDEEFSRKYAALCRDMKGIPPAVKQAYGIDEKLDRSGAIGKIRGAEKKDLYVIIDSIPSPFITKYFDAYLAKGGPDTGKIPSPKEAMLFWDNIRKKLDGE